jgi:hypothetical protein
MSSLKFDLLQTTCEAQNFAKTTHKITHQELFPSGVESGPGHHLPKIEMVMQHRQVSFFQSNQAPRGFFCFWRKATHTPPSAPCSSCSPSHRMGLYQNPKTAQKDRSQ